MPISVIFGMDLVVEVASSASSTGLGNYFFKAATFGIGMSYIEIGMVLEGQCHFIIEMPY